MFRIIYVVIRATGSDRIYFKSDPILIRIVKFGPIGSADHEFVIQSGSESDPRIGLGSDEYSAVPNSLKNFLKYGPVRKDLYLTKEGKDLRQGKSCVSKHSGLKFTCLLEYNHPNLLLKNFYYMMFPSSLKWNGAPLTDNEKLMIINAHNYFSKVNFPEEGYLKPTLRKRIAEALGVAEGTVGSVVADWNKHNDGTFTSHKILNFKLTKM